MIAAPKGREEKGGETEKRVWMGLIGRIGKSKIGE